MRHELMILLIGVAYTLTFRLLAWLRRDPFSLQFILEAMGLTALAVLLSFLSVRLNPILFLVLLYLLTMRCPLLVDLANAAARSGRFALAEKLYGLAGRLWPDAPACLVIAMNHGTAFILEGRIPEAISLLEKVLQTPDLSPKNSAATHYNLGVAYRNQGDTQKSNDHLHAAIEAFPGSVYARHAEAMLKKHAE